MNRKSMFGQTCQIENEVGSRILTQRMQKFPIFGLWLRLGQHFGRIVH